MHFFSATRALLVAAVAASTASAHNIVLPSHGLECFHESLHKDDKMTVTYQVGDREFGSAGNLDIDFWVRTTDPPVALVFCVCLASISVLMTTFSMMVESRVLGR